MSYGFNSVFGAVVMRRQQTNRKKTMPENVVYLTGTLQRPSFISYSIGLTKHF